MDNNIELIKNEIQQALTLCREALDSRAEAYVALQERQHEYDICYDKYHALCEKLESLEPQDG